MNATATGRRWVFPAPEVDRSAALIAQRHNLPHLLANVLAMRGIKVDEVDAYLAPDLDALTAAPERLADLTRATARFTQAVMQRERIAVFGDYDVDGACSVALLVDWLRRLGQTATWHVPHRVAEGYGPNVPVMTRLGRTHDLVITVDCGSSEQSEEALASAGANGADVVVLDHHPCANPPQHALATVNPNRPDDTSGRGYLCAAGVTYHLVLATTRQLRANGWFADQGMKPPDPHEFLDLVGLATVADVVPLRGLNRAFVKRGLEALARRSRPGIRALCDVARIRARPDEGSIAWMLGPRLNAPGRVGEDAGLATRLLLAQECQEAEALARECERLNTERKHIQDGTLEEAEAGLENTGLLAWAAHRNWHPGVVGIVAGRVAERHSRPAMILSIANGAATGSGRSVPGLDLGAAILQAQREGLLLRGGGHAAAVGLSVSVEQLPVAMHRIGTLLEASVPQDFQPAFQTNVAGVLAPAAVSLENYAALQHAGPHGADAPLPKFVLRRVQVTGLQQLKGQHFRLDLADGTGGRVKAMAFGSVGTRLGDALATLRRGALLDALGTVACDDYGGGRSAYLRLEDLTLIR